MAEEDETAEEIYARNRIPDRFYVSRRFALGSTIEESKTSDDQARFCRFAYSVVDAEGEIVFDNADGWEVVLRQTPSRQQIKALFFEDSRSIDHLVFQRFSSAGNPMRGSQFALRADEVRFLKTFLSLVESQALDLADGAEGLILLPDGVDQILSSEANRREIFHRYLPAIAQLIASDVRAPEVIAMARRREQIASFERLLKEPEFFSRNQQQLREAGRASGAEAVWQNFFELNKWIFGTALLPQFLHSWNPKKLEQTVTGTSLFGDGRRPDAVMRTAGALSALVFVEIKTHTTPLLWSSDYRHNVRAPSEELSGGVAQCQSTVDEVVKTATNVLREENDEGFQTNDFALVCRPRSILVAGSLSEFRSEEGVSIRHFQDFERYRRSITDPEIITYDELFERASFSLQFETEQIQVP